MSASFIQKYWLKDYLIPAFVKKMTHHQIALHEVTKKLYIGLGLGVVELYLYSFNSTESKV